MNKLNHAIRFASLFLLILLFATCCKDKNPNIVGCQKVVDEYYVKHLNGAEKYLLAKPGSYWIYKNTQTAELDTQIVTDFAFITDTVSSVVGRKKNRHRIFIIYDRLFVNIYSTYNDWFYLNKTNTYAPLSNLDLNDSRVLLERIVGSEGSIFAFFHPFKMDGSTSLALKSVEPTLTLNIKSYSNVAIFEIDSDDIWYPDNHPIATQYPISRYYWAENVGLIKRENVSENYSWELIAYNIIQ